MRRRRNAAALLPLAAMMLLCTAAPSIAAVEAGSRDGRALLDAASSEPVDLPLSTNRLHQTTEHGTAPPAPADHRVLFRLPAAYVALLDDTRYPDGRGQFRLRLWSRSLDPVRPDERADHAACPNRWTWPCPAMGPEGGRVAARRRAGEFEVAVDVTSSAATEQHRRYALLYTAGVVKGAAESRAQPCDTREDPALGMLVSRTPEGMRPMWACGFGGTPSVDREGRVYNPIAFLKLGADGAPRFAVKCGSYSAEPGAIPKTCRLRAYYGVWPLIGFFPSDRVAEWEAAFERVLGFLERHAVSRTE